MSDEKLVDEALASILSKQINTEEQKQRAHMALMIFHAMLTCPPVYSAAPTEMQSGRLSRPTQASYGRGMGVCVNQQQ